MWKSERKEKFTSNRTDNLFKTEKRMMKICSFYEYEIMCRSRRGIVIRDSCNGNIYRYHSAEELVKDWEYICRISNDDYIKSGLEKPFKWL